MVKNGIWLLGVSLMFCLGWSPAEFKKPNHEELKKRLTPLQFSVTQKEDTERPFQNEFYKNDQSGIYVDIVSGEPLFSSTDKFDSGTGWPSFTKPIAPEALKTRIDKKLWSERVEVRSRYADSHLGHVFDDGPKPLGKRYCINSAALRFIPLKEMKVPGYEQYIPLFTKTESQEETAIFAGGCFWCLQPPFDSLKSKGVISTRVGYSGGKGSQPTYEQVSSGTTGHREVIEVKFDRTRIQYRELLDVFWKNIDPFDDKGQFCDKGQQYQAGIYFLNSDQEKSAREMLGMMQAQLKKTPVIFIELASPFYSAEDYHQDYYLKNPIRYKFYRLNCGRDKRLKQVWEKKP